MEAVLFMGIQASGKSSFFRERMFETHVRLNMDMLRTRHRESILLRACIEGKARFVVDNTNPTREERRRYIEPARAAGYRVTGYYFQSSLEPALVRNARRAGKARIPDAGVRGTYGKLELPSLSEGFDELFYVSVAEGGGFDVQEWNDDV
jgi:predicted kinase